MKLLSQPEQEPRECISTAACQGACGVLTRQVRGYSTSQRSSQSQGCITYHLTAGLGLAHKSRSTETVSTHFKKLSSKHGVKGSIW